MSRLFIIGLGGFIGSVLRYLLSGAAQHPAGCSTSGSSSRPGKPVSPGRFLALVDDEIAEGLATLKKAEVRFYRPGRQAGAPAP